MQFKFTTAGESHGKALVAVVEGLPAGLVIDIDEINRELWRRQQGYGRGGRMKIEVDSIEILSGVRHGKTLGSPIAMMIENRDFMHWQDVMSTSSLADEPSNPRLVKRPRPGHADLAGGQKFQARDLRDILERASARETAARVACGAFAKHFLRAFQVEIRSHVIKVGSVQLVPLWRSWEEIRGVSDTSPLRCVDSYCETQMVAEIDAAKSAGDTLGGIFEVVAVGVPAGLGSHVSWCEKIDAQIAQAMMSIQAVKAVEIGTGVSNAGRRGSEVHDEIFFDGRVTRTSNNAGGIEGGITNGEEVRVRGFMKPLSTLRKRLKSYDIDTKREDEASFERSDITAVPAAGVIGEAMLAIVLANEFRRKFGGDSMSEALRNYRGYAEDVSRY